MIKVLNLYAGIGGNRKLWDNCKVTAIEYDKNIAEVYKYCIEVQKLTEEDCRSLIKLSGVKIIDFCEKQALITARIIKNTRRYGLSLGDRGCIALAIFKNCPILTCDKIWQKVEVGIEFILAR